MKKHATLLIALALCAVTVIIYSRAVFFPFALIDDSEYVVNNSQVHSGLSPASIVWAFTSFHASNWHPLTWLSLMLDSHCFSLNPQGYHLVNILLHAGNVILLFLLFLRMTGARWRSAFVAACFALHPLHVESVVWISERKDVLSTFFLLLTLLSYLRYTERPKFGRYLASLALFACGLMAKPMLVTVPVILLLIDFWPLRRLRNGSFSFVGANDARAESAASGTHGRIFLEKLPFLALSLVSSIITLYAQSDTVQSFVQFPLGTRLGNAVWAVVAYVRKMFVPVDLAFYYPYPQLQAPRAAGAALLLACVLLLVLRYGRRFPFLLFGTVWYLVTLVPVLGLVQVGSQSMADRYTYIPLIGLFTVLSWGGGELRGKLSRYPAALPAAALAVLCLMAASTWFQVGYWRDNVTLAEHAIEVTDSNYVAHCVLGRAYEKEGRADLALEQYREALGINPLDAYTHLNLGSAMNKLGRVSDAEAHLKEAVRLMPRLAQAHFDLGAVYARGGRTDEAIREYGAALQIDPANIRYHNNIGTAFAQKGMFDEAIRHFSFILQLSADDSAARDNLELALRQKNQK